VAIEPRRGAANGTRQAYIIKELIEIIPGAEAL